jgi:ATP-binding protein involved in chromosome partitioning
MSITEEQVRDALKSVKYPGFTRDIVSFGLLKSVQIENGEVRVQLALATNDPNVPAAIKNDTEKALRSIDGVQRTKVLIDVRQTWRSPWSKPARV